MNHWWPRAVIAGLLCLPPNPAFAQGVEQPRARAAPTLPSEPQPASLEAMRANYQQQLNRTGNPEERNALLWRLANTELAIATQAANSEPAARRALNIYKNLLRVRSYGEREADLLYRAAHAAALAGDTAGGIIMLTRLIDNFPRFKLIPEAYFRRAETRFLVGNYRLAEEDYSWLLTHAKNSPFYLQALYKRGWSHYKLGDYSQALRDQLAVLRLLLDESNITSEGALSLAGLPEGTATLAEDALRNMTLDFALLAESYPPWRFAREASAEAFTYVFVKNLFDYYVEHERYTDASQLALDFARYNPQHPKAKALEAASIEALKAGGYDDAVLAARQKYVLRYGLGNENWEGQDPLTVPEVRERLRSYLDDITRSLHAKAQSSNRAADYLAAADWYAKYLQIFPDSPRAAELVFYRADTLLAAHRYADAAGAYTQVAFAMAPNRHAAEAAYAAVLAWRKAAGPQVAGDPKVRTSTLEFAKAFPAHPQVSAALAKLMEELYNSGDIAGATEVATRLIQHQPPATSEQLGNAWQVRAAAAMRARDFAAAEAALSRLGSYVTGEEKAKAQQELATAIYRQAEALAKAGQDEAAAAKFLHLRTVIPPGTAEEIRAKALYDAAAAYIRAGNKGQAIAMLQNFRSAYPQHELAPEATRKLAELQVAAGNTAAASRELARVRGQTDLDPATRLAAAQQTAELSAQAGDVVGAIAAYEILLQDFHPSTAVAMEALHQLAVLNDKSGRRDQADQWRQRLLEAEAAAGPASSERTRTLAAQAALALAKDKHQAFSALTLTLPLAESLPVMRTRLKQAIDAFDQAARYGIAGVTTAATYYTGDLYAQFGRALLNSPRPPELSGQEVAQYDILLREQALPFKEKAISVQEANVQRMGAGIRDQWVNKSLAQLAELAPARFARQERMGDGIVTLQ